MSSTLDIFNDFDMTNAVVAMMQYVLITSHRLCRRIIGRVIFHIIVDKATKAHVDHNMTVKGRTFYPFLDQSLFNDICHLFCYLIKMDVMSSSLTRKNNILVYMS